MRQETNPPPYFASVNDTCSTVLQGADGLIAGANVLTRPAEEFDNDPSVEALWAMKALEHAEVYFNILCSVDPKLLKLTPHDDNIYKTFREEFPDLKVDILDEEGLKSFEAKQDLLLLWKTLTASAFNKIGKERCNPHGVHAFSSHFLCTLSF
ncbi:protein PBDC1 isoform X3 [Cryptotermes secundus]|uniref:protein PBDC1 isoform X3 n=1 Tax=Cryptotermes secundus TaxID=105785 RepID=UPI001454E2ED|nr:protein PBDC1 isoform X3 [Cryptotermes secundus]